MTKNYIFIVSYNYDWDESIVAFFTRDEAIADIAETFGCFEKPDTTKFWEEVMSIYEVGKWKGFQFYKLDPGTCQMIDASNACK